MVNLHRADAADWDNIKPKDRNRWQQLAASSHGWLTPANAVTLIGAIIALWGLYVVAYHSIWIGTAMIGVGRLADLADGIIADKTGTKSPIGEGVDAITDKTVLGVSLICLLAIGTLPIAVGLFMAAHGLYNTVINVLSKQRGYQVHPSKSGKIGSVFQWLSVGSYLVAAAVTRNTLSDVFLVLAAVAFIVFAVLSVHASIDYSQQFFTKRRMAR